MFAGKKSAQIREILINESAWEEMTCLFALSLDIPRAQNTFYNCFKWFLIYLKDDIEIVYSHIDHLKNMTQYNQHAPARHYAYPQYKVII